MSEIGIDVVEFLRQRMQIDDAWQHPFERGFVWWGHRLAQYVWAEPLAPNGGCRVHARTDLVTDFEATDSQLTALASFLRRTSLSRIIRDPRQPRRLQLACSVHIEEQSRPWLQNVFALAAALQVCEASSLAESLARTLAVRAAWSAHPRSGMRSQPDDSLNLLGEVVQVGQEPSHYRGRTMLEAFASFRGSPLPADGDTEQLTIRLPFGDKEARLHLSTRLAHPDLGNGLLQRLSLPWGANRANDPALVRFALQLNERELGEITQTFAIGSWCPTPAGLTHVTFFPNFMNAISPRCAGKLAGADVARSQWVTQRVFGIEWNPCQLAPPH